jgi:hypothetical protein
MGGRLGGDPLTSSADPTDPCLQAGRLARLHGVTFAYVLAAGACSPRTAVPMMARRGVAGVGRDRRLPCPADGRAAVITGAASDVEGAASWPSRPVTLVSPWATAPGLGVAPDLPDGVAGVEVCHLLAPVGNRGNEAGERGQRPAADEVELVSVGPRSGPRIHTRWLPSALPHRPCFAKTLQNTRSLLYCSFK